ncbi:amidase [Thalassococcus sp. S3]|uniref:amidase n=1 Tax=Thalassococcus sp. S3 TaxID=2017482 RepID=UPI0010247179|nr:amidase [Thalassococcus sp. S3]QBF30819.1 amidase [Thalassococcus sp. S3]
MNIDEYAACDATALSGLIADKEVTAAEVARTARAALSKANETLNFVAQDLPTPIEGARDGPWAGVPFLVKDLVSWVAGVPHRAGTKLLEDGVFVPPVSSTLVERFKAAGLNIHAITTTPEMGFSATTEAKLYGPTRNPWNTQRSAGGSSGGSAAAVAAGVVPVAHANDGGGSIRIPAASCGLVGLKPTRGRTPLGPVNMMPLSGMGIEFAVTRSVRDTAQLLDLVEGPEIGAFFQAPRPDTPYAKVLEQKPRSMKIAYMTHLPGMPEPVPGVIAELEATAEALRAQGHQIVEMMPKYDVEAWRRANFCAWMGFTASAALGISAQLGRELTPDLLEPATLACVEAGSQLSAMDMEMTWATMAGVCGAFGQFMTQVDAILLPTLRQPALELGKMRQDEVGITAQEYYDHLFALFPYCAQFNMTGQPALSVPMGLVDGLPTGAQLVGRMYDEASILQLAGQLEEARPWAGRRPTVHVADMIADA